jgi:hypothetical protein
LLLWASVLWMIPNQRRSMLRCSPYIVLYAEFLLLSQYIYGMDLTDEELPKVSDVELTSCTPMEAIPYIFHNLFVKCLHS